MTQQRSDDEIRADVKYLNHHEAQTGRRSSAHVLLTHDVEPLLARAERAEAQVRAVREQAESWRNNTMAAGFYPEASAYANAVENCGDALVDLLAEAGLSLQEEQE